MSGKKKALQFVVTGALLTAPLLGCGGDEDIAINEPAPPPEERINEPAPPPEEVEPVTNEPMEEPEPPTANEPTEPVDEPAPSE